MSLVKRQFQGEMMDDPNLDAGKHRHALKGLGRLNAISRCASRVFSAIADIAGSVEADQPIRVLDLATGGGDLPVKLAQIAARKRIKLEIAGCDVSATALDYARQLADLHLVDVDFFELNAVTQALPMHYDVITCSLFLHHLSRDNAVRLLKRAGAAAERRLIVNDLARTPTNLCMVYVASRVVTRSKVVHTDATRSVRAAFTASELKQVAENAGLHNAVVRPAFPCRMMLIWDKHRTGEKASAHA